MAVELSPGEATYSSFLHTYNDNGQCRSRQEYPADLRGYGEKR